MTEYVEVLERDGAARIAELRLEDPLRTPALADEVIEDAGSRWVRERDLPDGRPDRVTVLPHRGFPTGTDRALERAFDEPSPAVDFPSAAVVTPTTAADHEADVYVLSTASGIVDHPTAFRDAIVGTRRAIPDDTALYLSGVATPANVALLAYVGVDLIDAHRAVLEGTRGRYLTPDGATFLEDLKDHPCPCPTCRAADPDDGLSRSECVEHNVAVLEAQLGLVRERIRRGRLRDYLEGAARFAPWTTAAFRLFDQEGSYLEERTPLYRTARLEATTAEAIDRVEIRRFADRVVGRYRNRFEAPLVLLPCSASKPYAESRSHRRFREAIDYRAHVVSMTSPIGVVPQELELTYPAQHYDAAVTGRWSADEVAFVADVLERYLERNPYPRVIAHVPDGGYREVCERVAERLDLRPTYTVSGHPTDDASLEALAGALADEPRYGREERRANTLRAIADYQFGDGAGDRLFPSLAVQSRHPKLRAHDPETDEEQLAAMVPQYGTLALTIAGARRWVAADVPTARVAIDAFVPHGNVLAPGVREADRSIRVGDEVVVEGPEAFGVGRAAMHGAAMVESTRGVAVDVRHVEERS